MRETESRGKERMIIPSKYIIEVGLLRKRGICAKCGNKIDIPNHHIQLCRKCRLVELDKFVFSGDEE